MIDPTFLQFIEQHQHLIETLSKGGVFAMKNGSITVHFDADGIVRKIETHKSVSFKI